MGENTDIHLPLPLRLRTLKIVTNAASALMRAKIDNKNMERKLITEEWLNEKLECDTGQYGTFPTSSDPDKKYYEWEISNKIIIDALPNEDYSVCIKFFNGYDFETEEIRKIKYQDEVEIFYFAVHGEKLL